MRRRFIVIGLWLILLAGCSPLVNEPTSKEGHKEEVADVSVPSEMMTEDSDGRIEEAEKDPDQDKNVVPASPEDDEATVGNGTVEGAEPLSFDIREIDEEMAVYMTGRSFHENPHIQLTDLRYVTTGYIGFDGKAHQGAVIVNQKIAQEVLDIFTELYEAGFPIERMEPIDVYEGSDQASMVANNTSGFNYRVVAGTDKLSNHAYGLALDINPLINPWVTSGGKTDPVEGAVYADRSLDIPGMIHRGDVCYEAFVSRGFSWGGDWKNSKDYQHFDLK